MSQIWDIYCKHCLWSIFGPCWCTKSCKTTFYAHLSRIWKLARFTCFIRKVFAFCDSGHDSSCRSLCCPTLLYVAPRYPTLPYVALRCPAGLPVFCARHWVMSDLHTHTALRVSSQLAASWWWQSWWSWCPLSSTSLPSTMFWWDPVAWLCQKFTHSLSHSLLLVLIFFIKHTLNSEITLLYQFHAQKALFKIPKICNINFLIENDLPPPFGTFPKVPSDLAQPSFPNNTNRVLPKFFICICPCFAHTPSLFPTKYFSHLSTICPPWTGAPLGSCSQRRGRTCRCGSSWWPWPGPARGCRSHWE